MINKNHYFCGVCKNLKTYFGRSKKIIEKRINSKKELKTQAIISIVVAVIPVIISILGSIFISAKTINSQNEISKSNLEVQTKQVELNSKNSYPAFEFEEKDLGDGSTQYILKKTKGEMNNVSFSVFEIISGQGSFNGTPVNINLELLSNNKTKKTKDYEYIHKYDFNIFNVEEQFESLSKKDNLNFVLNNFMINRYYHVSYMNFEHEFKEEFYSVGDSGVGQAIESPRKFKLNDLGDTINISGSFGTTVKKNYTDDSWLTQKIYDFISWQLKSYPTDP